MIYYTAVGVYFHNKYSYLTYITHLMFHRASTDNIF